MKIIIKPTKNFLKVYPEYKKSTCLFLGWDKRVNKKWGSLQIKVKFGNRRAEFVDVGHFQDLKL